ncbi:alcohol oxidase-like protein [Diplogelasinospora grovesii]|uniref:Alcohol oxidase-like protein n=1 Tax=Diplogelasinospora grovesii TaxID=303347 RepID=A0AAN6RYQ5_9PEZI|nr:alcohol oxidase-like protein [Diplogelasinospora grovesii]
MGLANKALDNLDEVDVIIAGGGTAACVVAARLAEADPSLSILVVERGSNNYNVPNVIHPALFLQHLMPGSKTAIFNKSTKSVHVADREVIVPSGGTLGGGSSINFMVYNRAQRSDFDSWKTPGWTADELLPYMKKLETYHGAGVADTHGLDGPIHISDGGYRARRSQDEFIEAARQLGYPEVEDLQNLDANNGFGRWMRHVSPEGRRQDAVHRYLHPKLQDGQHPNLHVLVESEVVRVLFDNNKRACAVEFTPNPDYQVTTDLTQHAKTVVKARKLVVVSAGAFGSPAILERSGIGGQAVLERAGVPVLVDLPGVGHDYQDHNLVVCPYRTALEPSETNDDMQTGRLPQDQAIAEANRKLGWNGCDVIGQIRPTEAEVEALGPEFREAWDRDFKDNINRPLMLVALVSSYLGDPSAIPVGQYVSVIPYTAYPYSRGSVHITGPEVSDPLDFDAGYFESALDVTALMWGYKKGRELIRRAGFYRGEVAVGHPKFPPGSKAACVDLQDGAPREHAVQDIPYSAEDDQAIVQHLRENVGTTWHSLGTNKMAPREQLGVVDGNLNVHGVSGLKVVDLSIAPENVAANTNNTALTIGEKGADIIINELGLRSARRY